MMESLAELYVRQQGVFDAMFRLKENSRKEGSRRTCEYVNKQMKCLDELWQQFENTDRIICNQTDLQLDADYVVSKRFDEAKVLYQKTENTLIGYLSALSNVTAATTASAVTAQISQHKADAGQKLLLHSLDHLSVQDNLLSKKLYTKSISSKRSHSLRSSTSSRKRLQLQMLEEQRQLNEKRDKEYLQQKYAILQENDSDCTEIDVPMDDVDDRVNNWVNRTEKQLHVQFGNDEISPAPEQTVVKQTELASECLVGEPVLPSLNPTELTTCKLLSSPHSPRTAPKDYNNGNLTPVRRIHPVSRDNVGDVVSWSTIPTECNATSFQKLNPMAVTHNSLEMSAPKQIQVAPGDAAGNPAMYWSNMQPTYPNMPFMAPPASQTWMGNQYQPVPIPHHGLDVVANQAPARSLILSSEQQAARHSMPKELPCFSGRPEDWPIFISSFENSTKECGFSNAENLIRLQKCLKGKALEAVKWQLLLPNTVPNVIETLRVLYGRPEIVIHSLLQNVRNHPPLKSDRLDTLVNYALMVQNLCATIEASGLVAHITNPMLLQELVDKLSPSTKLNWAMHKQTVPAVTLSTFSNWLFQVAKAANEVILPLSDSCSSNQRLGKSNPKDHSFVHAHAKTVSKTSSSCDKNTVLKGVTSSKCVLCNDTSHFVNECHKFTRLNNSERWNVVKQNKLCKKCLKPHSQFRCKRNVQCGVNGCTYKHHQLLHNASKNNDDTPINETKKDVMAEQQSSCNAHGQIQEKILFRVVPIILYNKDIVVKTYAFLDEGSSVTLIEQDLADQLQLQGSPERLYLKWTGDTVREEADSKKVHLEISGSYLNAYKYNISNVRTVEKLQLPIQSVSTKVLSEKHPYLQGVPLESYSDAMPKLLVGIDNWRLGLPLEVREGKWKEPVATKTRLGWVLHGFYNDCTQDANELPLYHSFHQCEGMETDWLHKEVKEFFALDNFGVMAPRNAIESREDKRSRKILESTTIYKGDRYETGLLWKYDNIRLPNSFGMALTRLTCLEKQMARNPNLACSIRKTIHDHLEKGYVRKLTSDELNAPCSPVWYLPIFSVTNPNKPDKHRTVWDAAAKVDGVSLNSALLKGPDLVAPLIDVLYKFRERPIAITGDIAEMFHQVLIRRDDQHAQRFLWRENTSVQPDVYVTQVMTFGATCSPCAAQFVKNLNAEKYRNEFPRAVQSILSNHYVDDMLDCADTPEEALKLAENVRFIHSKAGFVIRNWQSNSAKVLNALGEVSKTEAKYLGDGQESTSKVLGMWWLTSEDTFTYSLKFNKVNKDVLSGLRRPTKREVLRTLMSIYDPLGLLASFLVYVKMLLQEIWRTPLNWDDQLTEVLFTKWLKWLDVLPNIEKINIPRCYTRYASSLVTSIQLHVFVDASENAFAAVAYFRLESTNDVECSLIGAKTKVAPQKLMSIPRLELQAALLGARFAKSICNGHLWNISKRFFWCDSRTVMTWLQTEPRRFRQFVAFRIGEILDLTDVLEWHWISTKHNVADEATKWNKKFVLDQSSRWISGPEFLKQPQNSWPSQLVEKIAISDEELRPLHVHILRSFSNVVDTQRFSSWLRLCRAVAFALRFVDNMLAKRTSCTATYGLLSDEELKRAENIVYRQTQRDTYLNEILALQKEGDKIPTGIDKTSTIYNCSPYLDHDGVLRMKGRIDAAPGVEFNVKRPILLPKNHHVTWLIIHNYHRRYHHHNNETVVNEIRQKYQIPRLRVELKKVIKDCQKCKIDRARPNPPEMANLPQARLTPYTSPFTFTGVDYFGPFTVTVGRRTEKRWCALFTCLTVRAVHIEIAYSLNTDSFIMALRNFAARRGLPKEMFSDNGTNFRGADVEIRKALQDINYDRVQEESFPGQNIKWNFNPPSAPHMGGCWERLIRSIKKTLRSIKLTRSPSDELLRAWLMEVENVVNSRPLTYVPLDSEVDEAITPNHFLLGSSNGYKSFGEFNDNGSLLKNNWKIAQQLANAFWVRWLREYLPDLTRRTKWYNKPGPIKKGDVVIIVDEKLERNCWRKGIVVDTKAGRSGQVRQAVVQTANGIFTRPSVKLAVLDVGNNTELVTRSD